MITAGQKKLSSDFRSHERPSKCDERRKTAGLLKIVRIYWQCAAALLVFGRLCDEVPPIITLVPCCYEFSFIFQCLHEARQAQNMQKGPFSAFSTIHSTFIGIFETALTCDGEGSSLHCYLWELVPVICPDTLTQEMTGWPPLAGPTETLTMEKEKGRRSWCGGGTRRSSWWIWVPPVTRGTV